MDETRDVEELFAETAGLELVEGEHRAHLEARLVRQISKEDPEMPRRNRRIAWAICALFVVAATAWGLSELRKAFEFVTNEVVDRKVIEMPDGSEVVYTRSVARTVVITSDDPEYTEEQARQWYEEVERLIAEGEKGELVRVEESASGGKSYVYRLVLPDGAEATWARGTPLGENEHGESDVDEIRKLIEKGELKGGGGFGFGGGSGTGGGGGGFGGFRKE